MTAFETYVNLFITELRNNERKSKYKLSAKDCFRDKITKLCEDYGYEQPLWCYYGGNSKNQKAMEIYGYCFDKTDASLALFYVDYFDANPEDLPTLTKNNLDSMIKNMEEFILSVNDGSINKIVDSSDEIIPHAREMEKAIKGNKEDFSENIKIRLVVLSNCKNIDSDIIIKEHKLAGKKVIYDIWTMERFYRLEHVNCEEIVNISLTDYSCKGLPCLKANLSQLKNKYYEAYLAIIPGKVLANIYINNGSHLLEGNVRSFLGEKKSINKGILSTINTNPDYFFTYNNGIAGTAQSIEKEKTEDGWIITKINDFRIINGGQTTACLAQSLLKNANADMDAIFVPMKLTVISHSQQTHENLDEDEEYQNVIERISRYANSQNTVSNTDFFSNHPFHKAMESKSRIVCTPLSDNRDTYTKWFYERSRGQWGQEQMKLSGTLLANFLQEYPKKQVISKEMFAKCYNAYHMLPYCVAHGASKNMKDFAESINKLWDDNQVIVNEYFFKKGVVYIMIYETVNKVINAHTTDGDLTDELWYAKGGPKSELIPYTISKIISLIPSNKQIDFLRIWENQALYSSFIEAIEFVAKITYSYLLNVSKGQITRSIAQKKETWIDFKNNYPITLPEAFIDDLQDSLNDIDILSEEEQRARIIKEQADYAQARQLGENYWKTMLDYVTNNGISLSKDEMKALKKGSTFESTCIRQSGKSTATKLIQIKEKLDKNYDLRI